MDVQQLARDLIALRKDPMRHRAHERYAQLAEQFSQAIEACTDSAVLLEILKLDSGHVLPTPTKQAIYEKLLAEPSTRTAPILRAFGMHLVMFGYTATDGTATHEVTQWVDDLFDEADRMG
ncbi:MAG: hypothetical protein ACOYLB_03435 [Phototrophicaceae bacterium]